MSNLLCGNAAMILVVFLATCAEQDGGPGQHGFEVRQPGPCEVELTRIAQGQSQASITQITFKGGGRRIVADNPETLAYFQSLLQSRIPWEMPHPDEQSFRSYESQVQIDEGCFADMPFYIRPGDQKMRVTFWNPDMHPDTYDLMAEDPPEEFDRLQTILLDVYDDLGLGDEILLSEALERWEIIGD